MTFAADAADLNVILRFEIEPDTSVNLRCPWCYDTILLTGDEVTTLDDVIAAAAAHDCEEDEALS